MEEDCGSQEKRRRMDERASYNCCQVVVVANARYKRQSLNRITDNNDLSKTACKLRPSIISGIDFPPIKSYLSQVDTWGCARYHR